MKQVLKSGHGRHKTNPTGPKLNYTEGKEDLYVGEKKDLVKLGKIV